MSANVVMVVFYSRRGQTEKLALAAGVGAIQARANIRLRRLADLASAEAIAADAEWSENLARMKKEYIAPREIDAQWANVGILAAPKDCSAEMERYLESASSILQGEDRRGAGRVRQCRGAGGTEGGTGRAWFG